MPGNLKYVHFRDLVISNVMLFSFPALIGNLRIGPFVIHLVGMELKLETLLALFREDVKKCPNLKLLKPAKIYHVSDGSQVSRGDYVRLCFRISLIYHSGISISWC